MSITVTVTPPSVVPAITGGATVQVASGATGVGKTTVGAALRLSVANIDDPSTELAALGDSTWPAGTIAICTQDVAGANAYRVYVLDLASSTAQSTPNRIDRAAGGQWILEGGKGVAGSFTVETTLAVGGAATVGGTLGVTGAATFASTLSAGASTLASATITGAATVGTTLGVTGAATLSSTLGVAGVASFTSGTASSSSSTGAVVVTGSGGLGVGGAVNAGGAIGSASTVTGTQLVSTVATGTAPLTVASTTVVPNLNVSQLLGATWASPLSIGSTTPAAGAFTTLSATGTSTLAAVNASGAITTTTTGTVFGATAATTSAKYVHVQNTGADFYIGVESSIAGSFFTGSAAYDSVVYSSGHLYLAGFGGITIGGGAVTLTDTTQAGLGSGAVVVTGGAYVAKDFVARGNTWIVSTGVTGNLFISNTTAGTALTGAHGFNVQMDGLNANLVNLEAGLLAFYTSGVSRGSFSAGGVLSITGTTASSSTSTGAVVIGNGSSGGLGVGGSINAGGTVSAGDFAVTINTNGLDFGHDSASKSMSIGFGAGGTTNFGDVVFYNGKSTSIVRFFGATGALAVASGATDDGVNKLQIGGSITTTGVYKVSGTQVVGARDTGWTAMTGSPDKATAYATGSVTLTQLAGRVAQLQAALTTHGLIGA